MVASTPCCGADQGPSVRGPGCGGFLLTQPSPHLEAQLRPEFEIALFRDLGDIVERVSYWLDNEEARASVAAAGYQRVLSEHTYDHRLKEIFEVLEDAP